MIQGSKTGHGKIYFSLLQMAQTGSGAYPAPNSMESAVRFWGTAAGA